jgi:hypothetical protein
MNRNAKRGLRQSGPSSENAHGGASTATVAHAPDNAKTEAETIADYWRAAKAHYQRGDYVDYGSDDWKALPIDDPRKMAGLVAFAELWRRYNPEIAEDFNRQLAHPEPLWQRATPDAYAIVARQTLARQQHRREAA